MFAHQLCQLLCDQFQSVPKRRTYPGRHCPRAVRRRVLFGRDTRRFQLYNYLLESLENVLEKEFVPRLSVRHSISTMLTVVVRAPISKSRSPCRAMKGEGRFSLTCASNGNFSGQGSCSEVVCDVTSGENASVTPQIDFGRIIYGTTYKAVCDTGHVFSDGSESFLFQCGAAGSAIEVPECNPVTCDVPELTNVENISVENFSFGFSKNVNCKDGYHNEGQESFRVWWVLRFVFSVVSHYWAVW